MIGDDVPPRLDIGVSFPLRCASPLVTDRETRAHRRGSKQSYGHCRRRTEIPGSGTPDGTPLALSRVVAAKPRRGVPQVQR